MAPFRPANLNKRAYPGNANVIGPTVQATLGISTTTCFSSTQSCAACVNVTFALGCRFGGGCACPCCAVCCSCPITTCTQSVPSGMWGVSEQYEAIKRGAWPSGITTTTGAAICLCSTDVGYTCLGPGFTDYKGFFICCGPSTNKWFVSPSCTEVCRSWGSRDDATTTANSCMGACGWFVPCCGQLKNPGYACRTYWDSYQSCKYWACDGELPGTRNWTVCMTNGIAYNFNPGNNVGTPYFIRAFRCTST